MNVTNGHANSVSIPIACSFTVRCTYCLLSVHAACINFMLFASTFLDYLLARLFAYINTEIQLAAKTTR